MSFPDYAELTDKSDGAGNTILASHINALQDAVKEIAVRDYGSGGGSMLADWDAMITVSSGTYTVTTRAGAEIASGSTLATLWNSLVTVGVRVHFGPGVFDITAELDVPSNTMITGEGRGRTILQRTGTGPVFNVVGVALTYVTHVTILHLTITGPSVSGSQVVGQGVLFDYASHCEVAYCEIYGFGSNGDDASVEVNRGDSINVHHNWLHDSKNGICTGAPGAGAVRVTRSHFDHNLCYDNFDDGIHDQCGAYNTFVGNVCWGQPNGGSSDGAGIDLLGSHYCAVVGNVCFDNARGFESGNTADDAYPDIGHTITGNTFVDNSVYGITIIAGFERGLIANNVIEGNASAGIRFGTATSGQEVIDAVIRGNQIHNNGPTGIDVFGYVTRPVIQDNFLSGHSNEDINVRTSTGTPAGYALLDNRTLSTTGIDDAVNAGDKVLRTFGA